MQGSLKKCANCKRRERAKNRTICHPCRNKKRREADPVRTSYENLKFNAKRRGKVFTISLAYFRRFCYRIKEWLGYIPGNIQKMKNGDNVRKYLEYCWQTKEAKVITTGKGSLCIIRKKIKFGSNENVTYICVTKANNMITVKDIIQGAKIETKVGVIEIGEIDTYKNFKLDNGTIVPEFIMVDTVMNGSKYRTELNDLVAFINENI